MEAPQHHFRTYSNIFEVSKPKTYQWCSDKHDGSQCNRKLIAFFKIVWSWIESEHERCSKIRFMRNATQRNRVWYIKMQLFEVKQTNVNHKDNKTRQFGEDVQPDMSSLLLSCVAGNESDSIWSLLWSKSMMAVCLIDTSCRRDRFDDRYYNLRSQNW